MIESASSLFKLIDKIGMILLTVMLVSGATSLM